MQEGKRQGLFRVSQEFASGWLVGWLADWLSMPPNGGIKQSIRGHKIQWQMSVRDSNNTVVGSCAGFFGWPEMMMLMVSDRICS